MALAILILIEPNAFPVTLSIESKSGTPDQTLEVPITVDDPSGIAGAAFTVEYDSSALSITVESVFFNTFLDQLLLLSTIGIPEEDDGIIKIPVLDENGNPKLDDYSIPIYIEVPPEVDGIQYFQPLLANEVSGTGMRISAARFTPADSSNSTLFTLYVTLKSGAQLGTYNINIVPTRLYDTVAGYDANGETIDLLIGADPDQEVTSASAFPVLLDDDGYTNHVNNGYVTFMDVINQEIDLSAGWNLISLRQQPSDISIDSVLEVISGKYASVWVYFDGSWRVYDPENPGFSDLTTMEAGRGYWINMDEATRLNISGTTPSNSVELAAGWNLVGYNCSTSQSVADALASIEGKYVSIWAYMDGSWKVYDPNNPGFSDQRCVRGHYRR
ncbi:MAG: hypothetical protein AMS27_18425 [Bacteroides sp. SM23_62_1]|nr:MAG: hypothetical protein AMS27_18425 [Bacteroides sp. SM23_62_1]